jgi:hypothetical protein
MPFSKLFCTKVEATNEPASRCVELPLGHRPATTAKVPTGAKTQGLPPATEKSEPKASKEVGRDAVAAAEKVCYLLLSCF